MAESSEAPAAQVALAAEAADSGWQNVEVDLRETDTDESSYGDDA